MLCGRPPRRPQSRRSAFSTAQSGARRQLVIGSLLLVLLLGLLTTRSSQAQAPETDYWQYEALGEIRDVAIADLDQDGFDEILVVTSQTGAIEEGEEGAPNVEPNQDVLDAVNATGERRWRHEAAPEETILDVVALWDSAANPLPTYHVAVLTTRRLVLLDATGKVSWETPLTSIGPALELAAFDHDQNGQDEILVLFRQGRIQLYDNQARFVWQYGGSLSIDYDAAPHIVVADLNGDGWFELLLGYTPSDAASRLDILNGQGIRTQTITLDPDAGQLTTLLPLSFNPEAAQDIAIGTDQGFLMLFSLAGDMRWLRTLHNSVNTLSVIDWPGQERLLATGTNVGQIIFYDSRGRRAHNWVVCADNAILFNVRCAAPPDSQIIALSPQPPEYNPDQAIGLVVTLTRRAETRQGTAETLLLSPDGRLLAAYPSVSLPGLTQLVDSNHDRTSELLLVGFGTLQLLDPGTVVNGNAQTWEYNLNASPLGVMAADIDQDGRDDLLISSRDGRLTRLRTTGIPDWIRPIGDQIVQTALLPDAGDGRPAIVVAYNNQTDSAATGPLTGYLMLLQPDSSPLWDTPIRLGTALTSLAVSPPNSGYPPLLVGTDNGHILAFQADRTLVWDNWTVGTITHLSFLIGNNEVDPAESEITGADTAPTPGAWQLAVSSPSAAFTVNPDGETLLLFTSLPDAGSGGESDAGCVEPAQLLVLLEQGASGEVTCFDQTLDAWWLALGGQAVRIFTRDALLWPAGIGHWRQQNIPIDAGTDSQSDVSSAEITGITSTFIGDISGDGRNDLILGSRDARVTIFQSEGGASTIDFNSPVFALTALHTQPGAEGNLVVITANGLVRLYGILPNYPPFLAGPEFETVNDQYTISIVAINPEGAGHSVQLEVYDAVARAWLPVEKARQISSERARLTWTLQPPQPETPVTYRFQVSDGAHNLVLTPPPGPPAAKARPPWGQLFLGLGLTGVVVGVGLANRQRQSAIMRSRRFYQQLQRDATRSLPLLEARYNESGGSADFLLHLANFARSDFNRPIASLAQGLFLMADQPDAGVPIINEALRSDVVQLPPAWEALARWRLLFGTSQMLLQAPSITGLCLLQPQLATLVSTLQEQGGTSPFGRLLNVMDYLDNSERVELTEDRIFYLNQAQALLGKYYEELKSVPADMERMLVRAVARRWLGRISAEIESLRGRANPKVVLKTKRIIPTSESLLALEIRNEGRAPAEDVVITLEEGGAPAANGRVQTIPFLPPGRSHQINFTLAQPRQERFRVAFNITYNDRQQRGKSLQFADMVHVLTPLRDFRPIANPYSPGTPLRKTSGLFFGRENLFNFIAEEAGRLAQQRVLILIGQRRTGKTSLLLRLGQHLPASIVPVYIDCQSLGIVPGIKAFFDDLALLIADELETRGLTVPTSDADHINGNPAHWFQHRFIPEVRRQLPAGTTLLLVFDEFEALESLVNDNILPPNLFPYLRHLMQHSEGLGFVFVGSRRLEEMTVDYWHVLFNIALYKEIGFLEPESAIRLITEPVAPNIVYDDLAVDKVLRMTAGHPYFLQLVCYALIKRANDQGVGYITISDVNAAVEEMLRLGTSHFGFLWERSTTNERLLLMAIAHLIPRDTPFRPTDLAHALEPLNIHLNPQEVTSALHRLVEREIMQEIAEGPTTLYALRIGLVGLWVEQNKSLSRLHDGA